MSLATTREGEDFSSPGAAIYGPKVMIIESEMAGSGGDAQPWYFRKAGIGPLVGKQTWGGLVGIWGYPDFIDGGGVTAPEAPFTDSTEIGRSRDMAPPTSMWILILLRCDKDTIHSWRRPWLWCWICEEESIAKVQKTVLSKPSPYVILGNDSQAVNT